MTPAELVAELAARSETVAVAESLTGGLLCSALVDVPGASAVLRGAVVAYATDLKHELLGVHVELLEARGAVDPDVAMAMADGARRRLGTTWGVSTTGVAGPDPQDGVPAGCVHVAVAGPTGVTTAPALLVGGRAEVRAGAVRLALDLLGNRLAESGEQGG